MIQCSDPQPTFCVTEYIFLIEANGTELSYLTPHACA